MPNSIKPKAKIKKSINNLGYSLINIYVGKWREYRVEIQDKIGYKYDVKFRSLLKNRIPKVIHGKNKFTLENISLFLKLNNKSFEICDKNIYKNNVEKLFFHCLICDEIFDMRWNNVVNGQSCPFCANKRAGKYNNFSYLRAYLVSEWDYEKNYLTPEEVLEYSHYKANWICINGHKWVAKVSERSSGNNCPFCFGTNFVRDDNRFNILYPEIASEWHPNKNGDVTPSDVSYGSNKKIWWLCDNNHEYYARIADRTIKKSKCPLCSESNGERKIRTYLNILDINYISEHVFENCRNKGYLWFDFYLSDYNLAIEFQGEQHYFPIEFFGGESKFKERIENDRIKRKYCEDNNISLLIIPYWEFENIEKILEKQKWQK